MALNFDDSMEVVKVISGGVTHNIDEVRVTQGGVTSTVWVAARPYTISTFDISEWTFTTPDDSAGDFDYGVASDGIYLEVSQGGLTAFAVGQLAKTLPTQGCNKLQVTYSDWGNTDWGAATAGGNGTIYGTSVAGSELAQNKTITFDISGDSIDFYFSTYDGDYVDTSSKFIKIHSLQFYKG